MSINLLILGRAEISQRKVQTLSIVLVLAVAYLFPWTCLKTAPRVRVEGGDDGGIGVGREDPALAGGLP